jgi:hypothetical protein
MIKTRNAILGASGLSRTTSPTESALPGDSNANGVAGADRNGVAHGGLSSLTESDATSSAALTPFPDQYQKVSVACPWLESTVPKRMIMELDVVFQCCNPACESATS